MLVVLQVALEDIGRENRLAGALANQRSFTIILRGQNFYFILCDIT